MIGGAVGLSEAMLKKTLIDSDGNLDFLKIMLGDYLERKEEDSFPDK